jgi:hypothetical protein
VTTTRALEHAIQHVKNGSTIELTTDDVLASWGLVRASRLSEMDAENKRLREIESFAQTAARWSNPERRHPHTIVSADEMLKAIWGHPSRAALEHQP